jgi:hypothetical protein
MGTRPSWARRRSARAVPFSLSLGLLAACAAEPGPLWLGLPDEPSARSLILGFELDGVVRVHALDPAAGGAVEVPLEGPVDVQALAYPEPLATLGLGPGPIEAATGPGPSEPLPAPSQVFGARLDPERDAPTWERRVSVSGRLAEFRRPRSMPACPPFSQYIVELASADDIAFVVQLDPTLVLVATQDGVLTRVSRSRGVVALAWPAELSPNVHSAWYDAARNRLWFVGPGGYLADAQLVDEQLVVRRVRAPAPGRPSLFRVDGSREGPLMLTILGRTGELLQWSDDRWVELGRVTAESEFRSRGVVLHEGPGAATVAWPTRTDLVRFQNGVEVSEPTASDTGLTTVARVPAFGDVYSNQLGQLFARRADGRHDTLDALPEVAGIHAILPWGSGFAWAGDLGAHGTWTPETGLCALASVPYRVQYMAPLPAGGFLTGGSRGNQPRPTVVIALPE